ncbi:MAG: MurR/RpiR family transcriptional regulator, partial [Alphaproteobacteria bacterium]|nr:MurR/RpiR family transcriptional regulator [Alphaproteobacteria bacterium]
MNAPARPTNELVYRIQERYGELRKSERIVADYLRENAGTRLDYSITEFARLIGVSEATVSRVSRALGYQGYPDMKLSLAEGAGSRPSFANIPFEIDETDSLITTSGNLVMLLSANMQGTQRLLDGDRLQRAVAALRAARKVVFIGVGGAAAMCEEASHLFMKAGLEVTSYNDSYSQIIAAANVDAQCVMIGISHTGTTMGVANALTLARENGATTISITNDPDSAVGKAASITFATWQSSTPQVPLYGDFLEGRISQLFLIDVLYLGLLFTDRTNTSRNLKITGEALRKYVGASEPKA